MSEQTFVVDNVGGVEHLEIKLKPGISVLLGVNGSGKTSAIQAVTRAAGGKVELERRDGSDHGDVHGPGVHLRVGKVVRRQDSDEGTAQLSLADQSPLSTLIDPGLKDSAAAARARIRALVTLLGVRVDDQAVETLAKGDAAAEKWLREAVQADAVDDLFVASEKLRGHLHALARGEEGRAEEAEGRAKSARERGAAVLAVLGGEDALVATPPEGARQALVDGSRAYERAVAQCAAREALETRQAEIREAIGPRPNPDTQARFLREAEAEELEAQRQVEDLEQRLAGARESLAAARAEREAARENLEAAEKAAERWDEQQAVLAQPLEGPTRDELAQTEQELVTDREVALQVATASESYREAEAERQDSEGERQRADREAHRLRDLAAAIPMRLGEVLARAGAPGLTVVDGRLHATIGGKSLDFERRLSDGQRVKAALEVAAQVYDGVVPLSGAYWASLDPQVQRDFAGLAVEKGLYVLTEQPADGDLRVETVTG